MDHKVRKYRVRVPEMIVYYRVEETTFREFCPEWDGRDIDDLDARIRRQVELDIDATMEIGKFGDADFGLVFDGAIFAESDADQNITVTELGDE